jgi:uncharacterized delta-60 repeat protein
MSSRQVPWICMLAALGCDGEMTESDAGDREDACVSCRVDAGDPDPDGGTPDPDGGSDPDAGTDGGMTLPPLPTEPVVIALSATGHDRVFAVAHGPDGSIYATGQIADGIAGADFELFVAKLDRLGELDDEFGDGGVARINVAEGGLDREIARGIVVQSSGRIVIAGTAEHDPTIEGLLGTDTDIVLVGFDADGDVDMEFGEDGIVREDLGTGYVTTNAMGVDVLAAADAQWGLALDSEQRLVIHGAARADGRDDTDYVVMRRLADGGVDEDFGGGDGIVLLDVGLANAGARAISVLEDNSILAFGYTTSSFLERPEGDPATTSQQPVIFKLTASGEFDDTFATEDAFEEEDGVWYDFATPLPQRRNAEAYGAAILSDGRLVTIGYGPTPIEGGMGTDFVSFRFSADGVLDETYGIGGAGYTYFDVGMLGDNGRNITALPDGRTLSVGAGRPMPPEGGTPEQDAVIVILSADGIPDTSVDGDGMRIFDLGGNDHFWGVDVFESEEEDRAIVGGIAAGVTSGTDDDDAAFLFLPL